MFCSGQNVFLFLKGRGESDLIKVFLVSQKENYVKSISLIKKS